MDQGTKLLIDVYEKAFTVNSGKAITTVNELTDQSPAVRPEVLWAARTALCNLGMNEGITKILSEDDKGAILSGLVAVKLGLPLAMARFYMYDIPGGIKVPTESEYYSGELVVNGINEGDKVLIIDDTLASGGTIISLGKAVHQAGAKVLDIRVVTEKLGYGGRENIERELGLKVKAFMGIAIQPNGSVKVVKTWQHGTWDLR